MKLELRKNVFASVFFFMKRANAAKVVLGVVVRPWLVDAFHHKNARARHRFILIMASYTTVPQEYVSEDGTSNKENVVFYQPNEKCPRLSLDQKWLQVTDGRGDFGTSHPTRTPRRRIALGEKGAHDLDRHWPSVAPTALLVCHGQTARGSQRTHHARKTEGRDDGHPRETQRFGMG